MHSWQTDHGKTVNEEEGKGGSRKVSWVDFFKKKAGGKNTMDKFEEGSLATKKRRRSLEVRAQGFCRSAQESLARGGRGIRISE